MLPALRPHLLEPQPQPFDQRARPQIALEIFHLEKGRPKVQSILEKVVLNFDHDEQ
jgi:hypothetical protein